MVKISDLTAGEGSYTNANTLTKAQSLRRNQALRSENGKYSLLLDLNGTLGLYENFGDTGSQFSWTNGMGAAILIMQEDGNLVAYDSAGNALFSSKTHPFFNDKYKSDEWKPVRCILENDGTLALYSATNKRVWTYVQEIPKHVQDLIDKQDPLDK